MKPFLIFLISALYLHTVDATTLPKVPMEELFAKADIVAIVEIKKGETIDIEQGSCGAVYEGMVVEEFKGKNKNINLEFGPYHGYEIGSKYLLFLNSPNKVYEPILSTNSVSVAAKQEYLLKCQSKLKGQRIMHGGNGALKVETTDKYSYKDAAIIPQRFVSIPEALPKQIVDEGKCYEWQECFWVPEESLIKYLNKLKNEL